MPVIAAPSGLPSALLNRRNGIVAGVTALAAIVSVAIASDPQLARVVGNGVDQGVHGIKTVAAMLAERSPGQRPSGALAKLKQLKHKRVAAALPLGRHVLPPVAAVLGTPAVPVIIPTPVAPAPLYNVVAGTPVAPLPITPAPPGAFVGPPILPEIPGPGGGGGVIVPPPIVTQVVPPPPATSAVPEPASWALMLLGLALIGRGLRRPRRASPARVVL